MFGGTLKCLPKPKETVCTTGSVIPASSSHGKSKKMTFEIVESWETMKKQSIGFYSNITDLKINEKPVMHLPTPENIKTFISQTNEMASNNS